MCGIAGFWTPAGSAQDEALIVLQNMCDALRHRGPDDAGRWLDPDIGIGLGHRRLAVIDLSAAGHQPMASANGRFVVAFNGEIYNHLDLRKKLGPWPWRGHSDTETLLAGIQQWGLEETLQRSVGMFAIALWDRDLQALYLARDRLGEKPLYYGWQGRSFLFASELKALRKHPNFVGEIDRAALAFYVRKGCVPTPWSIFSGIRKLLPGSIAKIDCNTGLGELPPPRAYWSLSEVVEAASINRFDGSSDDAVAEFEALLSASIKRQSISDVPIGAFLSGGIDSSTVVALMQTNLTTPVNTYTIGFEEQGFDEAKHARAVARHLGTNHTELYVSAADAISIIPSLPGIYDEPFSDASQIPTILVSRLARQHVTVALSGDGGDELFCGYGHYKQTIKSWNLLSKLPFPIRSALSRCLPASKLSEALASRTLDDFYQFIQSRWKGFPNLVVGAEGWAGADLPHPSLLGEERMMYADTLDFLQNDILVKVDRAAMSCSLETRMPLLDHRVVEFAWRLPIDLKCRNGVEKWPLKQLLYKYVPPTLVNRPKMGFGVPMHDWLRGQLKDWAEALLSEERLRQDGYFDPKAIREEWKLHLSGKKNRYFGLWTILMFQEWYKQYAAE